jgi:hypothetical protein
MGGFLKSRMDVRQCPRRINAKGKTHRRLICVQFILRSFFLGLFFRLLRVSRPQRVKIAQESSETPPGLEIEKSATRRGGGVWKEPRTGFFGGWDGFALRVCWEYGEAWWTRARRRFARLSAVMVAPNDRRECLVVDAGRGSVWPMSVGNKEPPVRSQTCHKPVTLTSRPAMPPQKVVSTPYRPIDADPHASRVISYMRPSDYAVWGGATAAAPAALYFWGETFRDHPKLRPED